MRVRVNVSLGERLSVFGGIGEIFICHLLFLCTRLTGPAFSGFFRVRTCKCVCVCECVCVLCVCVCLINSLSYSDRKEILYEK